VRITRVIPPVFALCDVPGYNHATTRTRVVGSGPSSNRKRRSELTRQPGDARRAGLGDRDRLVAGAQEGIAKLVTHIEVPCEEARGPGARADEIALDHSRSINEALYRVVTAPVQFQNSQNAPSHWGGPSGPTAPADRKARSGDRGNRVDARLALGDRFHLGGWHTGRCGVCHPRRTALRVQAGTAHAPPLEPGHERAAREPVDLRARAAVLRGAPSTLGRCPSRVYRGGPPRAAGFSPEPLAARGSAQRSRRPAPHIRSAARHER